MRDPARIDRILVKLGCLWEHMPDIRLGQLILTVLAEVNDYSGRLFYVEDDELEEALNKLDEQLGCGLRREYVNPGEDVVS